MRHVEWSLNYIGAGVGYLYTALEKESFSLSPGLVLNANYMMSGEQTHWNQPIQYHRTRFTQTYRYYGKPHPKLKI